MSIPPDRRDDLPQSDEHAWSDVEDTSSRHDDLGASSMSIPPDDVPLEQPSVTVRNVEDLTLAEILGQFWRAPAQTWDALLKVLVAPIDKPVTADLRLAQGTIRSRQGIDVGSLLLRPFARDAEHKSSLEEASTRQREAIQLGLRLTAVLFALYGSTILATERVEAFGLDVGAPYLLIAFLVWIGADVYGSWASLKRWWVNRVSGSRVSREQAETESSGHNYIAGFSAALTEAGTHDGWLRLSLVAAGLVFSLLTAWLNSGNRFTVAGILTWFMSIGIWVAAFAPNEWSMGAAWNAVRRIRLRQNWTFWTLLIIIVFGAYFRLNQLETLPPEMTSDHVEKVLDAQRILDGTPQVFFPNNGGREPIQFYILAFLKGVLGLPLDFLTLKLLTVLEGMISIIVLWWMGREFFKSEDRKLGNLVGVLLAALVAVSYWHTSLSRLGLRIVLTVSFTGVLIVFLSRALRDNRRGDYIKAGLVLGFGLYAYQAVRMLPVVIIIGFVTAVLFRGITTRFGQRGEWQLQRHIMHLGVLVVIAMVVFVPLFTFSLQYPNDFWRRTSGRLLGDDLIQTTDAEGNLVQRVASLDERIEAFKQNWPILTGNIRNTLLMYNWKGDVAWINAASNRPAMDIFTGALLIVGLAAWLVRMIRRRDAVDWLIPVMLFIMLLPSALSIAYPVENPSATRTSGTLPEAYLLAAFPLALICSQLMRIAPRRGVFFAGALSVFFVVSAYNANQNIYFGEYRYYYEGSSLPYSDAGKALQGFSKSGGSFGNAFMIAYPYWWDHRAIGIEAGLVDWPNGIVALEDTPRFLYDATWRRDRYKLDPDKDLLFFYALADDKTETQLQEWFPDGYAQIFESYQPEDNFKIYRVPALGNSGLIDFFVRNDLSG
jgi:hypothetical protein